MRFLTAIVLYLTILFSFMQQWLLLTVLAVLIFSFRYGAVALIPLAFLVDGYFGNFYSLPLTSMVAVWWYLVVEYLKPKLVNFR
ncbi:MAG: hypothetical protein KC877_02625 [Candidatus Kaiserbacteria bacterium]|nr:hypothetical protein [Candidatus Kaiserbacteria bacterium]MCB9816128.1 hypothetical protein [Candidatus Nomurabacteria bacterium]